MKTYYLTVFERSGATLIDESFIAENDLAAKRTGLLRIKQDRYENNPYRCVSDDARLLLFNRNE